MDFIEWVRSLSLLQVYGISVLVAFITGLVTVVIDEDKWLGDLADKTGLPAVPLAAGLIVATAILAVLWPLALVYTIYDTVRSAVTKK